MKRIPKRDEQEAAKALPVTLQDFLKEHTARTNAEGDQRRVMVSLAVAQSFLGMRQTMSQAAIQGATLNAATNIMAGKSFSDAIDRDGILDATLFAYELLAACAALVLREVALETGGDADAFPELDAYVVAFKAKRWGVAKEDASTSVN